MAPLAGCLAIGNLNYQIHCLVFAAFPAKSTFTKEMYSTSNLHAYSLWPIFNVYTLYAGISPGRQTIATAATRKGTRAGIERRIRSVYAVVN